MKKIYVMDTSAILHAPDVLKSFEDNDVVIPFVVLEELDKFKKHDDEVGKNCRAAIRFLDELRAHGSLHDGIKMENGGTLSVVSDNSEHADLDLDINDNVILNTVMGNDNAILVTNDINLRVKADAFKIPAEPFGKKSKHVEVFNGLSEIEFDEKESLEFQTNKWTHCPEGHPLNPNEYLDISLVSGKHVLGRYHSADNKIKKLIPVNTVFGIHPRSEEQNMAFDALLDDKISLVTIIGNAGTGKTLLAIAAGLEKILNEKVYKKLLVARPIMPMGKDIGYLPGDLNEKLGPWMQPIVDNLDFLFDLNKRHVEQPAKKKKKPVQKEDGEEEQKKPTKLYDKLKDDGTLQIEALTYIRGRSIPDQFIIIDEAQNLTPHEVKTIITRAGTNTKIILTGDCEQIDSPYLDSQSNGLAYCINQMKHLPMTAHITLLKGERSELAEAGSECL